MTATATPRTRVEIAEALGRELEVVRTSRACGRTSATTSSEPRTARSGCGRSCGGCAALAGAAAIVYARSRRSCEEIARTLCGHGIRAEHYHAGLEADERTRVQDAFVSGRTPVRRRDDGVRDGHRQGRRPPRRARQPPRLARELRADGRPGGPRRRAERHRPARGRRRRGGAAPLRARRRARRPSSCARVYRALREPAAASSSPRALAAIADDHDPRVLVGMLEQAGIVRRGYDEGRAMRVELTSGR